MKFYELAVGARFVFRGRRFEKIAMSMARDEEDRSSIFLGETEVVPEGVPLLLPPAEAEWWEPARRYWADYLTPAPGQRERGGRVA
jgi:hypothetical protein